MSKRGKDNSKFIDRTGEVHYTNQGYKTVIIKYYNSKNCNIKFENGLILYNIIYGNLKLGKVSNPYHPTHFGVGYIGQGRHLVSVKGEETPSYVSWTSMLARVYKENQMSYKEVTVCNEWKCFQNFAEWCELKRETHMEKWCLDKDILFKGNKIYSPETCCFVPPIINTMITNRGNFRGKYAIGVKKQGSKYIASLSLGDTIHKSPKLDTELEAFEYYKLHKENRFKIIADEWKNLLDPEVYTAILNYKIEITD